jgi:hypothetical protein
MTSATSADWIRALRETDRQTYGKSALEVFVIGGISILPLGMAAYGTYLIQKHAGGQSPEPYSTYLANAVLSGQLFYYAMSFIAAIIWHSGQDIREPFPFRIGFWGLSFVNGMMCAFSFGVAPALPSTGDHQLSTISIMVYALSAFMYFLILVFKHMTPPSIERSNRESAENLAQRVAASRGQNQ